MLLLCVSREVFPVRFRRLTAVFGIVSVAAAVVSAFSPVSASASPKPPKKTRAAMVRVETARLRSGPSADHKPTGLLDAGRKARVIDREDGWVKVRLASGTEGWVRGDLLSVSKKLSRDKTGESSSKDRAKSGSVPSKRVRTAAVAKPRKKAVVVASSAAPKKSAQKPVYKAKPKFVAASAAAATPKKVVAAAAKPVVAKPKVVTVASVATTPSPNVRNARFLRGMNLRSSATIAAASIRRAASKSREKTALLGKSASSDALGTQVASANERPNGLIRSALSYRGTPYRMGSRGHGAFDCSGFTQFVFAKSGKSLPRTAAEQARRGQSIDRDNMMPGDLVFFKNTYKRGVSHVGIYVGNGQFVHASSRGGVRTNSLSESYYVNHWAGARRVE